MKLIAFTGRAGAGKDTAARILIEKHGYTKLSFASALKDAIAATFGWDRNRLEGDTEESRAWREQRDDWWSAKLGVEVTPRTMMQKLGTELFRNQFHTDIWVLSLERLLIDAAGTDANYVITDCRFANEAEMIRAHGGHILEIVRVGAGAAMPTHVSESGLGSEYIHEKIVNNGTVEELEMRLGCALRLLSLLDT